MEASAHLGLGLLLIKGIILRVFKSSLIFDDFLPANAFACVSGHFMRKDEMSFFCA